MAETPSRSRHVLVAVPAARRTDRGPAAGLVVTFGPHRPAGSHPPCLVVISRRPQHPDHQRR